MMYPSLAHERQGTDTHTQGTTQQQCVNAAAVTTAVKVERLRLKKPK